MRLQRFLARAGVASRRKAEDLIVSGRVAVNGRTVTELGTSVDPDSDEVHVDGCVVSVPETHLYYVLHKPVGYVTTMSDTHDRPTVADLIPGDRGLFPVGRLDLETSGALLVTTDGDMAHRLTHPSFHAPKVYRVTATGSLEPSAITALSEGITLDDGPTRPVEVDLIARKAASTDVRITLREGRKRQIRRMFEYVGHPVLKLHRESFGPVGLASLAEGDTRELTDDEVAQLRRVAGMER